MYTVFSHIVSAETIWGKTVNSYLFFCKFSTIICDSNKNFINNLSFSPFPFFLGRQAKITQSGWPLGLFELMIGWSAVWMLGQVLCMHTLHPFHWTFNLNLFFTMKMFTFFPKTLSAQINRKIDLINFEGNNDICK